MWPWAHLAVGYLAYDGLVRVRADRPPAGVPALLAAFGTQFPDLVDKPLAWSFGVIPNGRSLTHSLLTATLLVVLAGVLFRRRNRPEYAVAFGVGYLSHLAADALDPILSGKFASVGFLGWPLIPAIEYDTPQSFVAHFTSADPTPYFIAQLLLTLVGLLVWVHDGMPGIATLRATVSRRFETKPECDG